MKVLFLNQGTNFSNWGIKSATLNLVRLVESQEEVVSIDFISHEVLQRNYSFDPVLNGKRLWNRNSRLANRIFDEYYKIPRIADEFESIASYWINSNKTRYIQLGS